MTQGVVVLTQRAVRVGHRRAQASLDDGLFAEVSTDGRCGTVENLADSLFRTGIETCNGRREAWLWLSTWDLPVADVAAIQERWIGALKAVF